MKAILTILCIFGVVMLIAGPTAAIDKSKKVDPPAVKKTEPAPEKKDTSASQQKKDKPSYDDFIDRNKNGIDDRAEKSSPPKKNPPPAETPSKKNPKP